jgi:anti-sigma regulatory factor (Ser/Thr protein kinase)
MWADICVLTHIHSHDIERLNHARDDILEANQVSREYTENTHSKHTVAIIEALKNQCQHASENVLDLEMTYSKRPEGVRTRFSAAKEPYQWNKARPA